MTLTGDRSGVQLVAVTDDRGQFTFTSLPADRYTVEATKGGYLPWRYGSKRPGGSGTPIVVTDGQRVAIAMTLIKGSVLTGTVRDEQGVPLPDVTVTALRYAVSASTGERALDAPASDPASRSRTTRPTRGRAPRVTDDRGVYRIFGLAAGRIRRVGIRAAADGQSDGEHRYSPGEPRGRAARPATPARIRAVGDGQFPSRAPGPADRSRVNYAPVYHPAAIAFADATTITLGQSEERSGVDVLVRLVPTAMISGTVSRSDGTPASGAQVSIMDTAPSATGAMRVTRSSDDGTFAIAGINPGRYVVRGDLFPEGFSGVVDVDVAGRDVSTSIVLAPGVTVSGRLVFDGVSNPPDVKTVWLMVWPPPFGGRDSRLRPTGDSRSRECRQAGTQLRINGRPPAGWVLRSAMLNGVDASDIAFDIKPDENIEGVVVTLTDRGAEVSGRFLDAAGKPAPEYVLVLFSADRRFWVPRTRRTQQVRPDVNGVFVARDLPAGDYLISAVTDLEDGQWNDPAFLATLAANSPIKITLAEGDKKVQDIRVGGR